MTALMVLDTTRSRPASPARRGKGFLLAPIVTLAFLAAADAADVVAIPPRPEALEFKPLDFEPPAAAEFRHVLPDGTVVFLAPSKELPLVKLAITFKGGSSLDPSELQRACVGWRDPDPGRGFYL